MSRFATLNDLKKKDESKDNKKENKLYAGGIDARGGGSGVNVLGPPGDDDEDDDEDNPFSSIAKGARKSGAVLDGSSSSNPSRRITIYSNGITVDNGPLRDFQAPETQHFMRELQSGRLPAELGNVNEADVDLINKASEEYVPPAYIPFSNGQSLGAAPLVSPDTFILDPDIVSTLSDTPDPIDESKPTTTVQVRTLTGQRLKIKVNTNATILQLATCIKSQFTTSDTYVLAVGHPSKDLANPDMTIEEAGLLNTLVTMRKV